MLIAKKEKSKESSRKQVLQCSCLLNMSVLVACIQMLSEF